MNEKTQWLATDILGQIIMFCPVFFLLIGEKGAASFGYFSVGTWQAVSSVRYSRRWPAEESKSRRFYRKSLPLVLGFVVIPFWIYLLLYITPLMAIWYFLITICEFRRHSRVERDSDKRS